MVKYDWPIFDPSETQRLELDKKMVAYYDQLLNKQKTNVEALRNRMISIAELQSEEEQQIFEDFVTAETQRWIYEAERLFYMLRANPEQGADKFTQTFDEITDTNRELRELLISEITEQTQEWRESLSLKAQFAVDIRLNKALADAAQTEVVYKRFLALLNHEQAVNENRIDLLIQLGNAAVRLGNIAEGEKYFDEAWKLSQALENPLWLVSTEHALAWVHRLQGHCVKAAGFYRSGLEKVPLIHDERLLLWTPKNIIVFGSTITVIPVIKDSGHSIL